MNTQELLDGYRDLRSQFLCSGPKGIWSVRKEELEKNLKEFRAQLDYEQAKKVIGVVFDWMESKKPLTDQDRENLQETMQIKRQISLTERVYWRKDASYVGSGNVSANILVENYEQLRDEFLSKGYSTRWNAKRSSLDDELRAHQEKLRIEKMCVDAGLAIKAFDIGMPFSDAHRENIKRAGKLSRETRLLEQSHWANR